MGRAAGAIINGGRQVTSSDQEIERKFLVLDMPDLGAAKQHVIRQGYVTSPSDSVEVRLRQMDEQFFLCVKSGEGVVRTERETPITAAQFDALWPTTEGQRLEKTRWKGQLGAGLVFELDLYSGALEGLKTVEVEFPSEAEAFAFKPPEWFGADVTSDKRYKNKTLAIKGLASIQAI
ncbi:CYTH domain-containing protein [Rhodobacteraceae bacterium NNCM2]|nr:CYTH domain-containing protein [Coraliihabitans acroporae]